MLKPALCLLAGSLVAGAALADPQRLPEYNPLSTIADSSPTQHAAYLTPVGLRKVALRNEALRLRAADGGTLTAQHRAYLQAKLDRINKG